MNSFVHGKNDVDVVAVSTLVTSINFDVNIYEFLTLLFLMLGPRTEIFISTLPLKIVKKKKKSDGVGGLDNFGNPLICGGGLAPSDGCRIYDGNVRKYFLKYTDDKILIFA